METAHRAPHALESESEFFRKGREMEERGESGRGAGRRMAEGCIVLKKERDESGKGRLAKVYPEL